MNEFTKTVTTSNEEKLGNLVSTNEDYDPWENSGIYDGVFDVQAGRDFMYGVLTSILTRNVLDGYSYAIIETLKARLADEIDGKIDAIDLFAVIEDVLPCDKYRKEVGLCSLVLSYPMREVLDGYYYDSIDKVFQIREIDGHKVIHFYDPKHVTKKYVPVEGEMEV